MCVSWTIWVDTVQCIRWHVCERASDIGDSHFDQYSIYSHIVHPHLSWTISHGSCEARGAIDERLCFCLIYLASATNPGHNEATHRNKEKKLIWTRMAGIRKRSKLTEHSHHLPSTRSVSFHSCVCVWVVIFLEGVYWWAHNLFSSCFPRTTWAKSLYSNIKLC